MGFWDKVKNIITVPDEEYYANAEEDNDIDLSSPSYERSGSTESAYSGAKSYKREDSSFSRTSSSRKNSSSSSDNKVVDIHTTAKLQVVMCSPESYDEATDIADALIERQTVVLNLSKCDNTVASRIIDFLSGVAYVNGGKPKKIDSRIYIIPPYNVDIMGDFFEEVDNNNFNF